MSPGKQQAIAGAGADSPVASGPREDTGVVLDVAADVRDGLRASPKHLPSRLFYDAVGSALFEQITALPEYYLTRTELALFEAHAPEMMAQAGEELVVVELGAGSGMKTQVLLRALLERQSQVTYFPVDVSRAALQMARTTLLGAFPRGLEVLPLEGRYRRALEGLKSRPGRKLVLWIGSSVGNFEPAGAVALLRDVRAELVPGDALLLGTDLRKDPSILVPAYDDAQGITRRFNLNLLERINRELGGDFRLDRFAHLAVWNDTESRMESYLESLEEQTVQVPALGLEVRFAQGERIHTEYSYKYTNESVDQLLSQSRLVRERTWTDERGWFAEHLVRVA